MRRLICVFVVCICHKQVFSWRGSYMMMLKILRNGTPKINAVIILRVVSKSCRQNDKGAVWSGSTLVVQTFLSKSRYFFGWLHYLSHRMTKPTKWHVRPVKTQISLGIRPVWSVFAVRMKKYWVLSYPLRAQWRLWSDWANAQADLSLHCAQSFSWFCHEVSHLFVCFFICLRFKGPVNTIYVMSRR